MCGGKSAGKILQPLSLRNTAKGYHESKHHLQQGCRYSLLQISAAITEPSKFFVTRQGKKTCRRTRSSLYVQEFCSAAVVVAYY